MMQITEDTFEHLLQIVRESPMIALRDVTFIDPYGMVGILEIGETLMNTRPTKDNENPSPLVGEGKGGGETIYLPESEEVLKYLERMDFFKFAGRYFRLEPSIPELSDRYLRSSYSDVLLEITPIEKSDDIHFIVGRVKECAHAILTRHLHYDDRAINSFIVALSEVCQNIIEHSEAKGFVGIQKYRFQTMGKNVVKIAVMDTGIGFRKSLSERFSLKNDLQAIEKALLHGASRYADEGRGHGLAAVKRFVNQWNGKLSIRSGRARLSIIPDWAWGKEKDVHLAYFPGAQINIMLPEM
ncbi:MAG: sensor histidine kinase [Nitrospirae bacterium]|nr:sensor histidine kinase [Nitrospirota bacterium]